MSVINTNITSMISQGNLNKSKGALTTAMERLSSGMRINSAKDDAAGQAIANRMTAQVKGLAQAQRNANDGISVAQTAEGALNQINDNLQRIRELTVQSQNGTNSSDDLTSIQNEIGQRLTEINRISEETSFNGVKVLASEQNVNIQVGANDGQVIKVGLKQINANSLGLNGFNVNGSGETQNPKATVTNVEAVGGTKAAASGGGEYAVLTKHEAASFEDVLGKMQSGNTVALSGGNTYTYNAAEGNFSYTATKGVNTGSGAAFVASQKMIPATGEKTATYQIGGKSATFEITSTGGIKLNGQDAYISSNGELTNNNGSGAVAATIALLTETTATNTGAKLTVDGVTYTGTGGATDDLTYTATATAAEVKNAMDANAGINKITVGDGFASKVITTAAGGTDSNNTYVDEDGELTSLAGFATEYNVNKDTGEVTVHGTYSLNGGANGSSGTELTAAQGAKYIAEKGTTAYVSGGKLTTKETTAGTATEDPLATLDSALKMVDALRSDLGAIQNRFESAITNLNTNETNLSAARSRIEDADYAKEVANMTRAQILQQAGTSVLAQANQVPQGVLSLLR